MASNFNFNKRNVSGTSFVDVLVSDWPFEETVARLITLTGQDPTESGDDYKVSVEFVGTYNGDAFTLYDYKEDRRIHIGGSGGLKFDVVEFTKELNSELAKVEPTPYKAKEHYSDKVGHQWPLAGSENAHKVEQAENVKLVLSNGARPILWVWNAKGTGIVLAEWNSEFVTWHAGKLDDGIVSCEHGRYHRRDFKEALKDFRGRVDTFLS